MHFNQTNIKSASTINSQPNIDQFKLVNILWTEKLKTLAEALKLKKNDN